MTDAKLKRILDDGGLMIVESPTKAKEITKFLPSNGKWKVIATKGFMFELMQPSEIKDKPEYRDYSVRTDDLSFERLLKRDPKNSKVFTEIRNLVKSGAYNHFYVSTDPDDAGELIGRDVTDHLSNDLRKAGMDVRRASWHEITKTAVEAGLESYGSIDVAKADSAEARRVYDRLFGYSVSKYMWKTVGGSTSGGRAQSPCLRLIVDREKERMVFVPASYGSIEAIVSTSEGAFRAALKEYGGAKLASGSSFGSDGKLKPTKNGTKVLVLDGRTAKQVIKDLKPRPHVVDGITKKPYSRKPPAPYSTSSMQQDIGNRLNLGSKTIMSIAQSLFESGIITYMRSASISLSDEATRIARTCARNRYGASMIPPKPRHYKNKNVSDGNSGHEAIRPATQDDGTWLDPDANRNRLNAIVNRGYDVYKLIYERTVASQMIDATGETTTISLSTVDAPADRTARFTASGTVFNELGWMRAYGRAQESADSQALPEVREGEPARLDKLEASMHETQPPARYTEPQLVAKLEELGIGRPSTYASIVTVNQERGYVKKHGSALVPTWNGMKAAQVLESGVPDFVSYDYTANMDTELDKVADGTVAKNDFLKSIWTGHDGIDERVNGLVRSFDPIAARKLNIIHLPSGYQVDVGFKGAWLQDPNGPKDDEGRLKGVRIDDDIILNAGESLSKEACEKLMQKATVSGPRELGILSSGPYKGRKVIARDGQYGPYVSAVELGRTGNPKRGSKPITVSIPEGVDWTTIDLDYVERNMLAEVHFPRYLDEHWFVGPSKKPGKPAYMAYKGGKSTGKGRRAKAEFRSLPDGLDVRTVTLDEVKKAWEESDTESSEQKASKSKSSTRTRKSASDDTDANGRKPSTRSDAKSGTGSKRRGSRTGKSA